MLMNLFDGQLASRVLHTKSDAEGGAGYFHLALKFLGVPENLDVTKAGDPGILLRANFDVGHRKTEVGDKDGGRGI